MVVVKPFRGLRYNAERVPHIQAVVSQPYDKIDSELQQRYYALSPYNVVRIIHGQAGPDDRPDGPNVYSRALGYYRQWLSERVLIREDQPAFYAYEQVFQVDNYSFTRLGLIAAVELAGFHEGIVLPHERTHPGPKEDRLRLLTALQAHTEQIFLLYPDPANTVNALLRQSISQRAPDIAVTEIFENNVQQRLWTITDPAVITAIQAQMAPLHHLIVADGHHRYETGLTYRDIRRQEEPGAPPNAAFNYIAATLVSMDDPGLVILPTHREICNFSGAAPADVLARAQARFTVEGVPDLDTCLHTINAHPTGHAFGFYGDGTFYVLTLKDAAQEHGSLAVSVLHRLLIEQAAGVPRQGIEEKSMIRYHRDAQQAVDSVNRREGNFVFFLSPTRIEHIKACAARGEIMPQKSTDFYPKMISGLVMLSVAPGENL